MAYPDGYDTVRDGYLGHTISRRVGGHTPRLTVKKMGEGQLAPLFAPLADTAAQDSYDGAISFESVSLLER